MSSLRARLLEVCAALAGEKSLPRAEAVDVAARPRAGSAPTCAGKLQARRALEIAAAGQHHLLFVGTPGCGKTLLASRLPGLLPEASEAEALESAAVASDQRPRASTLRVGACARFARRTIRAARSR